MIESTPGEGCGGIAVTLTRRVEVRLDAEQYRVIEEIARSRGETVAALVRRAVEEQYLRPDLEKRRAAVQRLLSLESDLTWEEAREILRTRPGRRLEAP